MAEYIIILAYMKNWYEIANAEEVDSPALLIFPERVKENISLALKISSGASFLRPHVKTHKMKEITEMMLEAGISKFKCATIAEAEMLALAGARDILLAYQPTLPKARRFIELIKAFPGIRFSCLIDNKATTRMLSELFTGKRLEVFIDLNAGMNRTGVEPDQAFQLYRECRKELENISIAGLHIYDGHLHIKDLAIRTKKANKVLKLTRLVKQAIEEVSGQPLALVMGGTPCFPIYARERDVETSPGTFVFWDEGYRTILPDLPFSCAAALLTRVISRIDEKTVCLDLGHKSVAAENPLPLRIKFPGMPEVEFLSQSEEHLVVRMPEAVPCQTGDVWYGIPYHICPTVALYETAHVIHDHAFTGKWPVMARNRKINF